MSIQLLWSALNYTLWGSVALGLLLIGRLNKTYLLILLYLILSLVTNELTIYFRENAGYNLFLLPVYSFLELLIFSYLYLTVFIKHQQRWLVYFSILMHLLIALDLAFLTDLFNAETFFAFGKVVSDITIVVFALIYYKNVLEEKQTIEREYLVLNAGFVSYFALNLLIFSSINFLINESLSLVDPFWILNAASTLAFYLFLMYMLWQHGKTRKTLPSG